MHILYVSQYFPPEMGAPAARVWELSREWVRVNHRVTVITGFPNHPTGQIPPEYRRRLFQRERRDGIDVVRTWLYAAPNRGKLRRMCNYLSFPISALALGVPSIGTCDVVIGTSPQLLVGVAGLAAAAIKRRPFVFEVRDLWPDSITAVEGLSSRVVIGALRRIEESLYRRADRIVVVARSTRRIISQRGFDATKIAVVPNGVDLDFFRPGPPNDEIRRRFVPEGGFLVSYIGTHGMAHGLETVLSAAEMLASERRYHFLLVGEGAEKDKLVAIVRERRIENVTLLAQQPRASLPEFYRASDLCLVPLRRNELFRSVLPSKMFEIMGCGRPILLGVEGEARELLQESGAGLAVQPESATALRDAIMRLASRPDEARGMGEHGRSFVEAHYSRSSLAANYLQVLEETIKGGPAVPEGRPTG
jgi:putative colanic acid biosynthesis glycosyltransferase WcaI